MLVSKIMFWAFATATATALLTVKDIATKFGISETDINEILSTSDVSSINVDKWADFLDVSLKDIKSWPQSDKVAALEDVKKNLKTYMESDAKVEKRQDNHQKLQQEIDAKIAQYRSEHEDDHRRRLAGCHSVRCGVCDAGLTVAYVAALTACDLVLLLRKLFLLAPLLLRLLLLSVLASRVPTLHMLVVGPSVSA
ncbi:hypothetical protein FAGAP_268 [Fusarium agapanthi]|uniref:Multiprotein-bridging factor 1 n=1 Tax=Fusarium agapanthi TaxID=1803897 RepID=A0A9P5BK10_9HYPO|nr:hypothetical protein FAGAP_268 [Fusarium agapanthi]